MDEYGHLLPLACTKFDITSCKDDLRRVYHNLGKEIRMPAEASAQTAQNQGDISGLNDLSARRLKAIVNSQPDCVKTVDRYYNLLDMNSRGLELIGAGSMDQVRGVCILDLVAERHRQRFKDTVDAAFRGETREEEFDIVSLDGTPRRMSQRSAPLFDPDNPEIVIEMVAVTRDITEQYQSNLAFQKLQTELKAALKEAENAETSKSKFFASMSHDLRTPLNAIIGFSDMIVNEMHGSIGNPKYADYIRDINNAGNYLLNIVNNILEISLIDSGKKPLKIKEHNLMDLAMECYGIMHMVAAGKNIECCVEIPEDLPPIKADRQAMMQVIMNLSSNAIKFTPNNGIITFGARVEEKEHVIEIIDTGIGIAQENLETIIRPFERIEVSAGYAAQEGTGLGLTIANSLVEIHGGKLEIESELGSGTKVSIRLPS